MLAATPFVLATAHNMPPLGSVCCWFVDPLVHRSSTTVELQFVYLTEFVLMGALQRYFERVAALG
ncbi:unnamed protein product, partial [Citrullus colocynthis]